LPPIVALVTTRFEVTEGAVDAVPELRAVFASLHQHHRGVSRVELTEPDEAAWNERQKSYLRHFAAGEAILYVARPVGGGPAIGYALALIHSGDNGTFPWGAASPSCTPWPFFPNIAAAESVPL
jgi:hypothetical protein